MCTCTTMRLLFLCLREHFCCGPQKTKVLAENFDEFSGEKRGWFQLWFSPAGRGKPKEQESWFSAFSFLQWVITIVETKIHIPLGEKTERSQGLALRPKLFPTSSRARVRLVSWKRLWLGEFLRAFLSVVTSQREISMRKESCLPQTRKTLQNNSGWDALSVL